MSFCDSIGPIHRLVVKNRCEVAWLLRNINSKTIKTVIPQQYNPVRLWRKLRSRGPIFMFFAYSIRHSSQTSASGEAIPSIEAAKSIADAFDVSLDYLVGEGINASFDKKTVKRLQDIQNLDADTQAMLFRLIDTVLRDTKAKKAYAS